MATTIFQGHRNEPLTATTTFRQQPQRFCEQWVGGVHHPDAKYHPVDFGGSPPCSAIPSSPMLSVIASSTRRSPSTSPGRATAGSKPASLRPRRKTRKHPP